jgi:hypothetical protein
MMAKFDVFEVDIDSGVMRVMGKDKDARNAEAIERMAIMRRGNDDNFFVTCPAGKFSEGDKYQHPD